MDHTIALSFEDGVTRFITCAEDQTIADAAYRARINIPLDCNDGACGTCKGLCESGTYNPGRYVEDALSADEAAKGMCLPCKMTPKSDLVIQIRSTSEVAKTAAATYTGTVRNITTYSATTMGFSIEIPNRDVLAYLPGQYVNINIPGTDETRSYSFSTAPTDGPLEFLIKLVPGGAMSTWLSQRAKDGDEISFTGPHGSFFLREATRPVLLLAGGTGLAPILSMVRTLKNAGSARRVHLLYGATVDEDVIELETIDALARELRFTWDYCVADKATKHPNQGYVTALINDEHLHSGDVDVYLCGPPAMVEAVRTFLDDRGDQPHGFYYEKFTPAASAAHQGPVPKKKPVEQPSEHPQLAGRALPADTLPTVVRGSADLRMIAGQLMFPSSGTGQAAAGSRPLYLAAEVTEQRAIAGQLIFPGTGLGAPAYLDADLGQPVAGAPRTIAGQEMFAADDSINQLVAATADGYEIGEEHPSLRHSDSIFEAREALELGALGLVIGRLDSRQIAGYRLLAEATLPFVKGDQFVDAMEFTESNAAFHDYLFSMTGNEHLLQAYQNLGVKGEMQDVLKGASWCHPLICKDHVDMVDAVEAGDLARARELFIGHAERSKVTMRRAMAEREASKKPKGISPGRFDGKVVLITGAAQGIGEAVARRIGAEGGRLVLADRSELAETLAEELTSYGQPSVAVIGNLETPEAAQAAVDAAVRAYGRLDVAIHNVGGTIWAKPFQEYAIDEIQAEVNRSLYPTLYGCRAALPVMIEQGGGTIVNVSSIATASIHRVPYAAAKGGVNAITRSLAMEAAQYGVRVVAAAAGGTEAPPRKVQRGPLPEGEVEKAWYQAIVDQTVESSLLKRYGTLDEQAAPICFLASDEASYITGIVVPVGGGDRG